jgi:hypothetical protein
MHACDCEWKEERPPLPAAFHVQAPAVEFGDDARCWPVCPAERVKLAGERVENVCCGGWR